MTLQQIKQAVDAGHSVHWSNEGYRVKTWGGEYYICHTGGYVEGLTDSKGNLKDQEDMFFILRDGRNVTEEVLNGQS